jgi:peptide/nickel transport system permease protein
MNKRKNDSYLSEVLSKLVEHKMAMVGLFVLVTEVILVIVLPFILNLNPYESDYAAFYAAPNASHWLGTDAIGRDVFSRLIYGGRTSLLVGFVSTIISCLIGVPLGLIAGYFRGKAEIAIMRVADVFMSFPSIILILVLVAVLGPSIWSVTIVIGVLEWTQFARLIYANVLSVSRVGKSNWYIRF